MEVNTISNDKPPVFLNTIPKLETMIQTIISDRLEIIIADLDYLQRTMKNSKIEQKIKKQFPEKIEILENFGLTF